MNHVSQIRLKVVEAGADAILLTDEKNQRYACGFPFTDGYVLIAREKAWLITDSRYTEAASRVVSADVTVIQFDGTHPKDQLLKELLSDNAYMSVMAEDRHLTHAAWQQLEKKLERNLLPSGDLLPRIRASKDSEEIRLMINAQRISEKALEETLSVIHPGMTEKEVAAELVYRMLRFGSEGNSFDPIVVTGKNTSLPHGVPGDTVLQPGDFLTMDFGSLCGGYCSDMTRTYAVCTSTEEMQNIYAVVLQAQLAGIQSARAGIPGAEIDAAARAVITGAGFGSFFGHGFGHSLGLDIHERPVLNPQEKTLMPEYAVVSAEPGIYLPGRFGVRIEDVMILHADGCEVITKAPKDRLLTIG